MMSIHARIGRYEAVVAGTFLVLMVLLIFAGGVGRLIGHPLNWTGDMATCLFAWACFLSADIAWRHDALMALEIVMGRLKAEARRRLLTINYLIILVFLAYGIVAGFWLAWVSRLRPFQGIPWISYSVVTLSLPVGCGLLAFTTIDKLRRLWRCETMARVA